MFEWDRAKARANLEKHGVSFADTFGVFEDPDALTIEQPAHDEDRYITIGLDAFGRLLVVVYTWRGDNVRIISARNATRSEIPQYESRI